MQKEMQKQIYEMLIKLTDKVDALSESFGTVESEHNGLTESFDSIGYKLQQIQKQLDRIEHRKSNI